MHCGCWRAASEHPEARLTGQAGPDLPAALAAAAAKQAGCAMSQAKPPKFDGAGRNAVATVRGQFAAERVVAQVLNGCAAPSALADAWAAVSLDAHAASGFARAVQKAMERLCRNGQGVGT